MSNTYTQLYIHCVFAVKFRNAAISREWDERLRLYIAAIIQNNGHKMLAINNVHDHLHLFIGLNPSQSISHIMQLVKGDSSEWINKHKLTRIKFNWQTGYGAFSHSKSQIHNVVQYILHQEEHHKKISFLDEYRKMLKDFEVDYNELYIFKELE
ncbi:MAG: transposase [Sediminibacterium sp.]|nr:transposase [Sediminibacterium sp.]